MEIDVIKIRRKKAEIGFALALTAIPLGMIAKLLLNNSIFGNLLMAIGLVMSFPFHRITSGICLNKIVGIVLYLLLGFAYYFITGYDDPSYLVYMGVSLLYCISLVFSRYDEDFDLEQILNYIWFFSLVFVIGGFISFATGKINILENVMAWNDQGDMIYDGLTMGNMAIVQIACSCHLLTKQSKGVKQSLLILTVFLDFLLVVFTVKRTPLLVALIMIFIYFKRLGYLKPTPIKTTILAFVIFAISAYIAVNPELMDALSLLVEDTLTGLGNLISGTHTGHSLTNSTDIRLENRAIAINMLRNFDIMDVCFGKGYMIFWCDIPVLQVFLDMGIMGFILYSFYMIFLPFCAILKYRNNPVIFAYSMCTLYGLLCCVTSGHPYANARWMPAILLCYALCNHKKEVIQIWKQK